MYKILKCDKDTYITDRVIKGTRVYTSNVGDAGTLDLFKLYGYTLSGSVQNTELSRLLIHFDLQSLRDLVSAGKLDISNSSFSAQIKLFDVYGGQPTPSNFTIAVQPLSKSFDEGLGKDVVFYGDTDVCNFLTASRSQGNWILSGCAQGGGLPGTCDYVTASTFVSSGASLKSTQLFSSGKEDLVIDVTSVISATIAGLIPDQGFRISLDDSLESDQHSYFVKRFSSRTAYNEDKRPRMIIKYDDSIQDDTQNMYVDSTSYVFMYNYVRQVLTNVTSGSSLIPVTGSNCMLLKLSTEISGGTYNLMFSGSQHNNGIVPVPGIYSASVFIPSYDTTIASKIAISGSVKFTPIWGTFDHSYTFVTGSSFRVFPPQRSGASLSSKRFVVTALGLSDTLQTNILAPVRVNIFDHNSPLITVVKVPVELPGIVIRDVHYQLKNSSTGVIEIPFDTSKNSTRVSSDTNGMFFMLDTANLVEGRSYVIDIMIVTANGTQVYKDASPVFRASNISV